MKEFPAAEMNDIKLSYWTNFSLLSVKLISHLRHHKHGFGGHQHTGFNINFNIS